MSNEYEDRRNDENNEWNETNVMKKCGREENDNYEQICVLMKANEVICILW